MSPNYQNKFYKDYEELQGKYDSLSLEFKFLKDSERRYKYAEAKKTVQVKNLKAENKELKNEIKELQKELDRLKTHENNHGQTQGYQPVKLQSERKKLYLVLLKIQVVR